MDIHHCYGHHCYGHPTLLCLTSRFGWQTPSSQRQTVESDQSAALSNKLQKLEDVQVKEMLTGADWWWLLLTATDWCWLMMIAADWCWLNAIVLYLKKHLTMPSAQKVLTIKFVVWVNIVITTLINLDGKQVQPGFGVLHSFADIPPCLYDGDDDIWWSKSLSTWVLSHDEDKHL